MLPRRRSNKEWFWAQTMNAPKLHFGAFTIKAFAKKKIRRGEMG